MTEGFEPWSRRAGCAVSGHNPVHATLLQNERIVGSKGFSRSPRHCAPRAVHMWPIYWHPLDRLRWRLLIVTWNGDKNLSLLKEERGLGMERVRDTHVLSHVERPLSPPTPSTSHTDSSTTRSLHLSVALIHAYSTSCFWCDRRQVPHNVLRLEIRRFEVLCLI